MHASDENAKIGEIRFDSIGADNKIEWGTKIDTKNYYYSFENRIEFYDDVAGDRLVLVLSLCTKSKPKHSANRFTWSFRMTIIFVLCMRIFASALTVCTACVGVWMCAFAAVECEFCSAKVWLPKNIFELMTDLMRKMKASACSWSSEREDPDATTNEMQHVSWHLDVGNRTHIHTYSRPNSQIAKQLHISKKFDEKSSHLLLLLLRCALRRRCCLFVFFSCFFFRFISLVRGLYETAGTSMRCGVCVCVWHENAVWITNEVKQ